MGERQTVSQGEGRDSKGGRKLHSGNAIDSCAEKTPGGTWEKKDKARPDEGIKKTKT